MSENTIVLQWQGQGALSAKGHSGKKMRYAEQEDEALMCLCREGDDAALSELFCRYKDRIYNFAYRLLGERARAEDVLQETFLRVHNFASTWQPTAKFSSWVFKIARNLCIDEKRKYWNRQVYNETQLSRNGGEDNRSPLSILPAAGQDPRAHAEDSAIAQRVQAAIESLSDEQKEVMVLSKYEGLSYPEIAEILGVSQESIKQRAYRAHLRLRAVLQPLLEEQAVR